MPGICSTQSLENHERSTEISYLTAQISKLGGAQQRLQTSDLLVVTTAATTPLISAWIELSRIVGESTTDLLLANQL